MSQLFQEPRDIIPSYEISPQNTVHLHYPFCCKDMLIFFCNTYIHMHVGLEFSCRSLSTPLRWDKMRPAKICSPLVHYLQILHHPIFNITTVEFLIIGTNRIYHWSSTKTVKSQPEGKLIVLETRFTECWVFLVCIKDQFFIIFLTYDIKWHHLWYLEFWRHF